MNYLYLLLLLSPLTLLGQSSNELLQDADRNYQNENFGAAEELYRKAREKESDLASNFNLGNTTFKQERYEEAIEHYLNATRKADSKSKNSDTHYNLGNAYFQNQQLEEAVEAYKQAIRLNPENEEAKYNLAYTKELMKIMQQQQQDQQQDQQQENQDENSEEQQENQEQQDQENQEQNSDQQQENQDKQEQQESEQDSSQQQQEPQPGTFDSTRLEKQTLDSLDAAKLLQIIQSEERKVQEKLRKYNSNRKKPDKDW